MPKRKTHFKGLNKTQTKEKVRSIVNAIGFEQEFEAEFISDLILEKHYFCSREKLRPSKFKKMRRNSGKYDFYGFFLEKKWCKVSWSKCISPPTEISLLTEALRREIQPLLFKYKDKHPICEKCCSTESSDVDHVKPEFKEICQKALNLMRKDDWDIAFDTFDWWNEECFKLPEHNPAVLYVMEAHKSAILQAVCKECHRINAQERKAAKK